ncbi:MAG TPA: zinc ribbon domain-containing protein [Vicinamibacteria bacterium]|nr:zinc ribbon domain-containing protein [Vicinamibacteria bacterium]
MPIYEYVCGGCRTRFEKLVRRFGEDVVCPSCSSSAVDRQLSVFAVAVHAAQPTLAGCGQGACAGVGGCSASECGGGGCGMPS